MRPEKQMEYKGITVRPSCLKCYSLDKRNNAQYRCCCKGSCPHYLSEDDREYIIENFENECEVVQVQEWEDIVNETVASMADELMKCEDERILKAIKEQMGLN